MINKSDIRELMQRYELASSMVLDDPLLDDEARLLAAKNIAVYMLVLSDIELNHDEELHVELAQVVNLAVDFIVLIESSCGGAGAYSAGA